MVTSTELLEIRVKLWVRARTAGVESRELLAVRARDIFFLAQIAKGFFTFFFVIWRKNQSVQIPHVLRPPPLNYMLCLNLCNFIKLACWIK